MFYGWKLAGVGAFGNLMLQGGVLYVMNAFMEPLVAMHGWSRAGLSIGMSIASVCGTISMPLAISLISLLSIRSIMTLGALFGGIAFISLGHVSELWLFTLCFAVVWMCGQGCGGVVANVLMGNWFLRCRGRAMGLVNMGTSLSGAVLPFIALLLVDSVGVRMAYTLLGSLVLALAPLCWIMVRDTPQAMNMAADGAPVSTQASPAPTAEQRKCSPKEYFGKRSSWIIGLAFGIGLLSAAGMVSQLKPRFVDVGMSSYLAMTCMCLTAFFAACGKYIWGWISDHSTPLRASKVLMLCNALSLGLIFLPASLTNVLLFVVLYGLCMGGIWTLFPAVVAYMYGMAKFSSAYKYASCFMIVKASGYAIVGMSFSITGKYDAAYAIIIALLFLAALGIMMVKESEAAEYTTANQQKHSGGQDNG